jgi:dihydrofolate reductase
MAMQKKQRAKAKYTGYVATSIDGRIASGSHSGVNWTSREDWNFFQKSLLKYDAIIAGHNTFMVAKKRLEKRNTIVITSKVSTVKTDNKVVFINPKNTNVKNFINKKGYKKVAVIGGGHIYDFCLKNQMLDDIYVTIEPFVFTAGVTMFQGAYFRKYRFSLESIKKLNKNGTILLKYKNGN